MTGATAEKKTAAQRLVEMALSTFTFMVDAAGTPFAVKNGEYVAIAIDGGRSQFRSALSLMYYNEFGAIASSNALAEATSVLRGQALEAGRCDIPLRHGRSESPARRVDLGGPDQRVALILQGVPGEQSFYLANFNEQVFRRTALTGAMPLPDETGTLDDVLALLATANVTASDRQLVVGWAVAVTLGDVPVPALFLAGEAGVGKTTTAKTLVGWIDPSPVPVRSSPRDLDAWIVAADGSRVVAIDNVSTVPDWLSDAWCRAVTGEGLVRRALYTDSELAVTTFRRALIITSIDPGALRGDLGERLLSVELDRITPDRRLTDAALNAKIEALSAKALGGLFNVTGQVLGALERGVRACPRPRMADFADVLASLDHVTGWSTLEHYLDGQERTMADLVAGDPLAEAVRKACGNRWEGTASDLLHMLEPFRPEDRRTAWPRTPKGLSGALRRIAASMRAAGTAIDFRRVGSARTICVSDVSDASDANDAPSSVQTLNEEGEGSEVGSADLRHLRHSSSNASLTAPAASAPVSACERCHGACDRPASSGEWAHECCVRHGVEPGGRCPACDSSRSLRRRNEVGA